MAEFLRNGNRHSWIVLSVIWLTGTLTTLVIVCYLALKLRGIDPGEGLLPLAGLGFGGLVAMLSSTKPTPTPTPGVPLTETPSGPAVKTSEADKEGETNGF